MSIIRPNKSTPITIYRDNQGVTVKGNFPIAPYFQAWELACPESHTIKLHDGFLIELSLLRKRIGKPFRINSCCRSASHNVYVRGHPRSLHLMHNPVHNTTGAMAVDVRVTGWTLDECLELKRTAWDLGWSMGIGYAVNALTEICTGYVHLDRRVDVGLPKHQYEY